MNNRAAKPLDVEQAIDSAPIGRLQWQVFAFCGLMMFADGFDLQALALTVPYLAREWGLQPVEFSLALSASPLAMGIGGGLIAPLGDRFGRKPLLVAALIMVGLSTLAVAATTSPAQIAGLRLLAGAGMGVVTVNAFALTSEYAPARRRFQIIAMMSSALALGAFAAAMVAPWIILEQGWRALFLIGGAGPLALSLAFALMGPESIKWLVARRPAAERVKRLARRMFSAPYRGESIVPTSSRGARASFLALLASEHRVRTLVIWSASASGSFSLYLLISWLPTLLLQAGWPDAAALYGAGAIQLGGVVGSIAIAWLVDHGRMMPGLVAGYAAAMVGMLAIALSPGGQLLWLCLLLLVGTGTAGMQVIWMSMATALYPLELSSTSAGWTSAVSRVGAIAAPSAGGAALAAGAEASGIMLALFVPLALSAFAVTAGRRHFTSVRQSPAKRGLIRGGS